MASGKFNKKKKRKSQKTNSHVWDAEQFSFRFKVCLPLQNPSYAPDQEILITLLVEASGQNFHFLESFDGVLRSKFHATEQACNQDSATRGWFEPKIKILLFQICFIQKAWRAK